MNFSRGVMVVEDVRELPGAVRRLMGMKGLMRPERPGGGIIAGILEFLDGKSGR